MTTPFCVELANNIFLTINANPAAQLLYSLFGIRYPLVFRYLGRNLSNSLQELHFRQIPRWLRIAVPGTRVIPLSW